MTGALWAPTVPGRLLGGCLPAPAAQGQIWIPLSYVDGIMGLFSCTWADIQPRCSRDRKKGAEEKRQWGKERLK